MQVEEFADLPDGAAFDFVVVGSGFGGSVAALRLAEKGYSVAVLEAGRHYEDHELPRSNWDLRRYLWLPRLFCYGIQRLAFLKDVLVLSGAGVGGGSLVYANTLLEPGAAFYESPEARRADPDLRERLRPHFRTARRMLGAAAARGSAAADAELRGVAAEMGRAETFHTPEVGVYFGSPGRADADPYFKGEGPPRSGCVFCGGCMVGCRHNAKNTLVKNYLPLAVRRGARVFSLTAALGVSELPGGRGGFRLAVRRPGWGGGEKSLHGRRLVVSAGVLGTLRLLLSPRTRLARLSPQLGRGVRTNSEVIAGATARSGRTDYSEGLAISAGFWPDRDTHVEAVRYPAGSDAMSLLAVRARPRRLGDVLSLLWPFGWARRTTILLFMQTADSRMRVLLKRAWGLPWRRLTTEPEPGSLPPPRDLPVASEVLRRFCERTGAVAQSSLAGAFGLSTTAHILGGAVMAASAAEGVVGRDGRAFGYEDLWILDGSIVPGNLGVNPSLTITALAEHAMAAVPPRPSTL